MLRRLLYGAGLWLGLLLAGCGGGGGAVAPGAPAAFVAASQSATLDSAGGSISLTAADGTVFRFDVPPGALTAATTMSLTTQSPLSGQQFRLQLQPAGLVLAGGATGTLTIQLPAGQSLPASGGLAYDGVLIPFTRLPDGRLQVDLASFAASAAATPVSLGAVVRRLAAAPGGCGSANAALQPGGDLVGVLAVDPAQLGLCMVTAVQAMAVDTVFRGTVRANLAIAAFLQVLNTSNADQPLHDASSVACRAYGVALDRARNTPVTTVATMHSVVDPVMYWERTVQQLDTTCAGIGLTDYQAVVHNKVGESLEFYGYYAPATPSLADTASSAYNQVKTDAVRSEASVNELQSLDLGPGQRSTLQTEVTQRVRPVVMRTLLDAPWLRCRNANELGPLMALVDAFGATDILRSAAQYCGTQLTVEVLDNQNRSTQTLSGLGGVAAGRNQTTGSVNVTADGVIKLTGPIKALRCPANVASSEELVVRFAGVEVRRLSVAPYLSNAVQFNISDLRAAASLANGNTDPQPLTIERIGAACSAYWGGSPNPLISVTLQFASNASPVNYLSVVALGKMHADGSDDTGFANVSLVSGIGANGSGPNPNLNWLPTDQALPAGLSATGFSLNAFQPRVANGVVPEPNVIVIDAVLTTRPTGVSQAQGTLWLAFTASVAGVVTAQINNDWPTDPLWAMTCLPSDSGWARTSFAVGPGQVVKLRLPLTRSMNTNCNGNVRSDAPEFLVGSGRLVTYRFSPNTP